MTDQFSYYVELYAPGIISGILVLLVGWYGARIIRKIARRVCEKKEFDPSLTTFLIDLLYILMLTFVVVTALGQFGVETNSFVAIIGAAGLAIGFALQGTLSNFSSGVMLMIFRPLKIGDVVEAAGTKGKVEKIQIFCTTLNTPDNKVIIVPNSSIMSGNITNYSTKPTRRVDLVFSIGYDDDLDLAKTTLIDIINSHPKVLKEPESVVVLGELADNSVNFNVRPWVNAGDYWTVFSEITESVKKAFDEKGISIPFPQRDVHVHQVS